MGTKIRLTLFVSISYILGLCAFFAGTVLSSALILLIVLSVMVAKDRLKPLYGIFIYVAFMVALVNVNFQLKETDILYNYAPKNNVSLTGRVVSIPKTVGNVKFFLEASTLNIYNKKIDNLNSKTLVTIQDKGGVIPEIGDTIKINGKLRTPFKSTNPSQFDYANYLRNLDTFTTFYADEANWELIKKPQTPWWKFMQQLDRVRNSIIGKHAQNLKSPNLEVLGGIVFGDDAVNPPDDIKQSFVNSGLLHLLAASGLNVGLIFGIWFFIATKLRIHNRVNIIIGMGLVLLYVCMTGFPPSVVRAAIMLEFILLGKLIDREADNLTLVCLVGFLMLLVKPAMLNNVGFQLSFLVTIGLITCVTPIMNVLKNSKLNFTAKIKHIKWLKGVFPWFAGGFTVPFVAQLWVAPLQMYYFNSFSLYSILSNMAVLPFVTLISFLGFAGSILSTIPLISNKIVFIFDFILNPILTILVSISDFFAHLPNSLLTTFAPNIYQIIFYYFLLLYLINLLKDEERSRKHLFIGTLMVVALVVSCIKFDNHKLEIIAFDVGNADSFLIKTPQKKYIMIDTAKSGFNSSSQAKMVMIEYLKDKAIKKLDLLVITHFDSDHAGGTIDILKAVKVKKVIIPENIENAKLGEQILEYLQNNKIDFMVKNTQINPQVAYQETFRESDLKLTIFNFDFKNSNDSSIMSLLSYKDFDVLFMADAGLKSFDKIKNQLPKDIEVLKVAHHGAKGVLDDNMLKVTNPKMAIISVGYNQFGHPNYTTIDTIKKHKAKILRTDFEHAIKISSKDGSGENFEIFSYDAHKTRFVPPFTTASKTEFSSLTELAAWNCLLRHKNCNKQLKE